jgi:hypothetical protein
VFMFTFLDMSIHPEGWGVPCAEDATQNGWRGTSFAALPQVAAALAGPPSSELVDGPSFGANGPLESVRSVHAVIPKLG